MTGMGLEMSMDLANEIRGKVYCGLWKVVSFLRIKGRHHLLP